MFDICSDANHVPYSEIVEKTSMPFPSKTIANNFLEWDFRDGAASVTPMKLQKLVYMAHGWHLAVHNTPLINEQFEAWPYGPVEDTLYHTFKQFRNSPISSYAKTWAGDKEVSYIVNKDNIQFYEIFDAVTAKYGALSALHLSSLTHMPGTPWSLTRAGGEVYIENNNIGEHFRGLVNG